MIEIPIHPVLDADVIYIVGMTGSGKTTIARETLKTFEGERAVVTNTPEEYADIENVKTFDDWAAALRHLEDLPPMKEKLLVIDENKPVDIGKFRPTNTKIIVLSQKYEPYMRAHTTIFLKLDVKQLEKAPLKESNKQLLERAAPGFGILRHSGEVPVYFYV